MSSVLWDSSANLEKVKSEPARLEPQLIPALGFRSDDEYQEPEVGGRGRSGSRRAKGVRRRPRWKSPKTLRSFLTFTLELVVVKLSMAIA